MHPTRRNPPRQILGLLDFLLLVIGWLGRRTGTSMSQFRVIEQIRKQLLGRLGALGHFGWEKLRLGRTLDQVLHGEELSHLQLSNGIGRRGSAIVVTVDGRERRGFGLFRDRTQLRKEGLFLGLLETWGRFLLEEAQELFVVGRRGGFRVGTLVLSQDLVVGPGRARLGASALGFRRTLLAANDIASKDLFVLVE